MLITFELKETCDEYIFLPFLDNLFDLSMDQPPIPDNPIPITLSTQVGTTSKFTPGKFPGASLSLEAGDFVLGKSWTFDFRSDRSSILPPAVNPYAIEGEQ
jgi:hypothetical protein